MPGVYFLVALLLAFVVAAALGWPWSVLLIRRLYGRPLDTLLATWGVGLMLQQAGAQHLRRAERAGGQPAWLNGGLRLAPALLLPYKRLFIIVLVVACLGGVYALPRPHRRPGGACAR